MIEMNEADAVSQEILVTQITRVARRSAKILKIAAAVLAVGAIVNGWISATTDQNQFYNGGPPIDFPFTWRLRQFLDSTLWNLGWAVLILAAAFAIEIIGLRSARPPAASNESPGAPPALATAVAPANFASRRSSAVQAPTPPPMKIASDEDIWRR